MNTQLQLYADDGLQLQNQVALPGFSNAGKSYVSHGPYLFWNTDASKLFAVTQADSSSGLLSDSAIYTMDSANPIPACNYSVSPSRLTVPATSYSTWYFDVNSNCTWAAVVTNATTTWLYSSTTGYLTGNGRASVFAYQNSGAARSTSIRFGDKTAVVTQAPASCSYSLSSPSRSFSQSGGSGEVGLVTDANCPWSLQTSQSWL